jgi:hypothetical protein
VCARVTALPCLSCGIKESDWEKKQTGREKLYSGKKAECAENLTGEKIQTGEKSQTGEKNNGRKLDRRKSQTERKSKWREKSDWRSR